jgi:hypothetical protein
LGKRLYLAKEQDGRHIPTKGEGMIVLSPEVEYGLTSSGSFAFNAESHNKTERQGKKIIINPRK